jgi:hypothetical protein
MKYVKKYWFPVAAFILSLTTALFWVALRVNHAGISKFLGADTNPSFLVMNLPVMVCILAWIGCILAFAGMLRWHKKKGLAIAAFVITVIVTVGAVCVVAFGAKDYMRFIMVHYWESIVITAGVAVFALVLLFPPKLKNWVKAVIIGIVVVAAVIIGYELRPCDFTYGAVVYAVEDD